MRGRARLVLPALLLLAWTSSAFADSAEAKVRSDLERFLRAKVGSGAVSIDYPPLAVFDIDRARNPGPLRTSLETRSKAPLRGRVPVTVALYAGDRLVGRHVVSPYVRVMERVVVASRDLRRGEVLDEDDLTYGERDATRMQRDALRDADAIVGRRLRSSIREGRIFRSSQIERVPVVERGDRVTLVLQSGGLQIHAIGRAQEPGASGEWIRVVNVDSRREISGRVDREGNVHVAF